MPTVISLCDKTGNMVKPWAEAGFDCLCIDTQHKIRRDETKNGITYQWADVRAITPDHLPEPAIIFAFPPCTHLSLSGAQDWGKKGITALVDALQVVEGCRRICEWYGVPWMLENPMSRLSTCWRKPDHKFTHWNYGDLNQKQTWIWSGNGFVMPEFEFTEKPDGVEQKTWKLSPGPERANKRAETPMGFARAVFEANVDSVRSGRKVDT